MVACWRPMAYSIWWGKLEAKEHLKVIGSDEIIILIFNSVK